MPVETVKYEQTKKKFLGWNLQDLDDNGSGKKKDEIEDKYDASGIHS